MIELGWLTIILIGGFIVTVLIAGIFRAIEYMIFRDDPEFRRQNPMYYYPEDNK